MPLIDDETKQIIIQKTWCHGQAVCPIYGLIILWWYFESESRPTFLVLAGLFLPYWCYLSYRSIFVQFDYRTILLGGILAEVSHAIVFCVALQELRDTMHMVMFITSILLFIETAAFLGVVTAFQPRVRGLSPSPVELLSSTRDVVPPESHQTESLLV